MKKIVLFIILSILFCGCTKDTVGVVSNNESSNVTETTELSTTEEATTEEVTTEISTTESPTTEEPTTKIQVSDDELNLMQRALLGKVDIYDTEYGRYIKVSEIPYYFVGMQFRFIDLDGDGQVEVILQPPMQGSILHEIDGTIYRYPISNRVRYHEDGTVHGSAGASYNTLFRISFTETEMVDDYIYWAINGKVYKVYEYEGEQIEYTEEEFAAIQEQYPEIMIDSYEFNHNNVVTLLGGGVEAETQSPTTEIEYPEETKVADDELNAIQRVMFNLDEFIDTADGTSKKVEELRGKFIFGHDDIDAYCFQRFVYQDLNGDGIKEVIAEATPGYQYIFYVLDGQIYMDTYTYKGMSDIRVDGVYCGDSGASIFYYSQITELTVEGAVEETVLLKEYSLSGETYNYLSWDDYNNKTNAISKEEADEIEAAISTERAIVHTFNRENVENVLNIP